MRKREIIRQFSTSEEIYDLNLPQNIPECQAKDMSLPGDDLLFGLGIVFDRNGHRKRILEKITFLN